MINEILRLILLDGVTMAIDFSLNILTRNIIVLGLLYFVLSVLKGGFDILGGKGWIIVRITWFRLIECLE